MRHRVLFLFLFLFSSLPYCLTSTPFAPFLDLVFGLES